MAELRAKGDEVRTATQQLWQAAKLASVGELAASIAHELNNPSIDDNLADRVGAGTHVSG